MSSTHRAAAPSHNLQAILSAALANYSKQTGRDIQNDPLSAEIRRCESLDEIFIVFMRQTDKFDEFRNGNSKLMKYLDPIVHVLQALSVNPAISAGVSLVSQSKFVRSQSPYFDAYCLGFPTRTNNLFWYQRPSHCAY
jgi:hypothetical protein